MQLGNKISEGLFHKLQFFKSNNRFDMMRMRKHINRCNISNFISTLWKERFNITNKSSRITTHINNFLCTEWENIWNSTRMKTISRRINNNSISLTIIIWKIERKILYLFIDKFNIFYTISFGICLTIMTCWLYKFNRINFFKMMSKEYSNCSCSCIEIKKNSSFILYISNYLIIEFSAPSELTWKKLFGAISNESPRISSIIVSLPKRRIGFHCTISARPVFSRK